MTLYDRHAENRFYMRIMAPPVRTINRRSQHYSDLQATRTSDTTVLL
jgi:hypothetical protein